MKCSNQNVKSLLCFYLDELSSSWIFISIRTRWAWFIFWINCWHLHFIGSQRFLSFSEIYLKFKGVASHWEKFLLRFLHLRFGPNFSLGSLNPGPRPRKMNCSINISVKFRSELKLKFQQTLHFLPDSCIYAQWSRSNFWHLHSSPNY